MMIRELMMNAIEAARLAPESKRRIEISAEQVDGTAKLAIWNTGPGMDAAELLHISNIASSIGKEKSLTGNFGMGAKVLSPRACSSFKISPPCPPIKGAFATAHANSAVFTK